MTESDVSSKLIGFIRDRFLDGDPRGELDDSAPLLEWGILTSLNTSILLNYIRAEFGAVVDGIEADDFRTVRSLTAMICR
ncbi:acyl carrier protein [Nonomuraea sp. 10N515B]|uniref:acyl carrier protein n=1 Tax=Nonomuraea sp. 10N515B TaxID=3457422 RepID=UPI003FCD1609